MKHYFLLLSLLFCFFLSHAQVSKTIDVTTSGTLSSLLTSTEKSTITNLTVTGNIDAQDVRCMRNEITQLAVLDLSQSNIQEYTGSNGTASGTYVYPANEMPVYSFHNSVTGVGKTSLTSISLPQTITSIGEFAFSKCIALNSIAVPDGVTTINDRAFFSCYISNLTLPNTVRSIGAWAFAFNRMTTVTIPNSVISMGAGVFNMCTSLQLVTIGNLVSIVPENGFSGCNELTTVYSLNTTPPSLGDKAFSSCPISSIYVPSASVNTYKSATGWGDGFYEMIFAIPSSNTIDLTVNYSAGGTIKDGLSTVASGSIVSVDEGSAKTFTIVPLAGYMVTGMTYNDADVLDQLVNNQYTTPNVDSDATLNVTIEKIEYKLTIESAENGAVVMLCAYADTPLFQFVPSEGWQLHAVYYNGTDVTSQLVDGKYTVPSINADGVLNVSYVSDTSTLAPTFSSSNIQVYNSSLGIVVSGAPQGETVSLYSINGALLKTEISASNNLVFPAQKGTNYIVKTQHKAFKVIF